MRIRTETPASESHAEVSGGSKGGGGSGGQDPPLRFPGKISCTWKNSLYLLKNSVKMCMIRSIS